MTQARIMSHHRRAMPVLAALVLLGLACRRAETPPRELPAPAAENAGSLKTTDLQIGQGEPAAIGQRVVVHYVASLSSGPKIDDTRKRGPAKQFVLGRGMVIRGLDLGVVGMKPGGKRRLVIPADLAYGKRGVGNVVPPGSEMTYEVELFEVRAAESVGVTGKPEGGAPAARRPQG